MLPLWDAHTLLRITVAKEGITREYTGYVKFESQSKWVLIATPNVVRDISQPRWGVYERNPTPIDAGNQDYTFTFIKIDDIIDVVLLTIEQERDWRAQVKQQAARGDQR